MSTIAIRRLEFTRSPGDTLFSGRVVLDPSGPPYTIEMFWRPQVPSWVLSLRLATGAWICRGIAVRDRTDCLLGVSTVGRPAGAIISYDPKGRGDPTLESYSRDDVRLYYLPDGCVPDDFAKYMSQVA